MLNQSYLKESRDIDATRGQWPHRPALKERTMMNRPMILLEFNFISIHMKE